MRRADCFSAFTIRSFEHQETKSSSRRAGGDTDQEQPGGEAAVREVPPVLEVPRRVRDTGTRASDNRTLSRGVETRQGTLQNVSLDTPFQIGERVLSVKMNFIEKGGNAINREETTSGDDVHNWSEEDAKMALMRETRIMTFMQMELEACLDEVGWLVRCNNCAVYNCPEEEYPPKPLPIPPDYIDNLQSRFVKVKKGILPPTLKMIIKTSCHLPAHQAPVT